MLAAKVFAEAFVAFTTQETIISGCDLATLINQVTKEQSTPGQAERFAGCLEAEEFSKMKETEFGLHKRELMKEGLESMKMNLKMELSDWLMEWWEAVFKRAYVTSRTTSSEDAVSPAAVSAFLARPRKLRGSIRTAAETVRDADMQEMGTDNKVAEVVIDLLGWLTAMKIEIAVQDGKARSIWEATTTITLRGITVPETEAKAKGSNKPPLIPLPPTSDREVRRELRPHPVSKVKLPVQVLSIPTSIPASSNLFSERLEPSLVAPSFVQSLGLRLVEAASDAVRTFETPWRRIPSKHSVQLSISQPRNDLPAVTVSCIVVEDAQLIWGDGDLVLGRHFLDTALGENLPPKASITTALVPPSSGV
ncbi:hypothetical protein C8A03DRAFT_38059 [Achaetomium macrosporum]|uniref:Uncharacterized protein n=1 Tax=Achaetomium macrosporum TaxID=79813 RepID=A0AAN7C352_9PEZI|nr:hypothetical protein C8A03DRAFT_38059 [Achaetomium macrosporum]